MLNVKTPEEAAALIRDSFAAGPYGMEEVPLEKACGRVLAVAAKASEYVPGFDRSTVDGYAVKASDTFGCSDSIPALLKLRGEVQMGEDDGMTVKKVECAAVPTGGALPEGAD